MSKHITHLGTPEIIAECEPFNYGSLRNGAVGVSNKANLPDGGGRAFDEFIGGPVSNATSAPTALITALPSYSVGYAPRANPRDLLRALCPLVPAGAAFQYQKFSSIEEFADVDGDAHKRSIGSEKFARVKSSAALVDGSCDHKGLSMFIDNRNNGRNAQVQQRAAQSLMRRLARADLREFFALLNANATAVASVNWGAANAAANPDSTLLALVKSARDAWGENPTTVLCGGDLLHNRKDALLRLKKGGATLEAYKTNAELAAFLGVPEIIESTIMRQATATAKETLGGSNAYTLWIEPEATTDDASSFKCFYDPEFGTEYTVFTEEKQTGVIVTVWCANRIVCTSNVGLFAQPVTNTN